MTHQYTDITVGVLALQGDYERHEYRLKRIGVGTRLVRLARHLDDIDALIIPGGESTTMDKLMDKFDLREPLLAFGRSKPIWGTCAGMILVARNIENNQSGVKPLGLIDIDVLRNAYGRQVFSFADRLKAMLNGDLVELSASFIRAPAITRMGPEVNTLAEFDGKPVLVSQQNILASSFHTELDDDTALLEFFLNKYLLGRGRYV